MHEPKVDSMDFWPGFLPFRLGISYSGHLSDFDRWCAVLYLSRDMQIQRDSRHCPYLHRHVLARFITLNIEATVLGLDLYSQLMQRAGQVFKRQRRRTRLAPGQKPAWPRAGRWK